MEDKRAVGDGHTVAKADKKGTRSGVESGGKEPLKKKKLKLDRSGLTTNVSKPESQSLSNGVKAELKAPINKEKSKQDGLKSPLKILKSPEKLPQMKPPQETDNADDDVPLIARAKLKDGSPSKSHISSKIHSANGEVSKTKLESPKRENKTNSDTVKKIKSPSISKEQQKTGTDGIKKIKSGTGSPDKTSPKVDGVKKIKSESSISSSSKVDGSKKIKSDSSSSKVDGVKKVKSESAVPSSPKVDGIKKIKSGTSSPKVDGVKKTKSETSSSKVDGAKKGKSESSSSKVDGVKKIKSESSVASSSPKVDGVKKLSESGKVDSTKKVKPESSSKVTSKVLVKKEKSESSSSEVDGGRKRKSEHGVSSGSHKVDGVKKIKTTDSPMSSPTKVDGIKMKSSTDSPMTSPTKVAGTKLKSSADDSEDEMPLAARATKVKKEVESPSKSLSTSEDDMPLSARAAKVKKEIVSPNKSLSASDDEMPLAARATKVKKEIASPNKSLSKSKEKKRRMADGDDDDDYKPLAKTKRKSDVEGKSVKKEKDKGKEKVKKEVKKEAKKETVKKEPKEKKPEEQVWKWWEEEKHPEGVKWLTLEHKNIDVLRQRMIDEFNALRHEPEFVRNAMRDMHRRTILWVANRFASLEHRVKSFGRSEKGPFFPPPYEPLPDTVNFYYDGKKMKLSEKCEEVAGFYAKMLDHEYTSKKIFNDNFFEDWRKEMSDDERMIIKNLSKCGFQEMHAYYVQKNEERKNMSKEDKQKLKEKNEAILQEYGYCMMDGHKERVGNFKIEPPGLFRGRGDHPKQGKLKKRVNARDVSINIGRGAEVPAPPESQRWKAVTHDNKVTWLACWIENIQGSYKYVMLNPTSRIKGEKDWQKYETARKLKSQVAKIRSDYTNDWRSKEMRLRQRGVALYFIDKLALRAGHEKDEDTADTVGCCSLRVEHIKLHRHLNNKECVVEFDFLGKDSIHYHNLVEVEKRVFKNLELFKQGKSDGDDLFDRLSTASLNKYLSELMEGLTAKVFRTYNASMTLQDQLNKLELEDNVAAKVLGYNRANRAVAILCNHQRTAPKTFEQSMSNLQQKIEDKRKLIKETKKEAKALKAEVKSNKTPATEKKYEKKKTALARLQEQLFKLEVTQTDKEENKEIALGTSKLNYLDPRISVAWCLKNDVPIEKIYNKTQRQKFAWAIDMTEEDFVF